jgi:hypothetical protein
MDDVATIEAALGRIAEGLQEARAATELLRDGDVTAMAELDAVVDAMAREVAELKSRTTTSPG